MVDVRQTERKRFQIHDGTFGLSLYERESAREALLDFFADRRRGELRTQIETDRETGDAFVIVDGTKYVAREVPE
jgi:hypothetical protein